MNRMLLMCKSYKTPSQCSHPCSECWSHAAVGVDFCDICGAEIDDWAEDYDDYHNKETGKDICKKCRMKGANVEWK